MAKPYTVTITNGTGTASILKDNYTVSADVNGYENSTINPTSITYDGTTVVYDFTIAATGSLTLHVTEDGLSTGIPVVGAKFYRTDSLGNTYGSEITTDASGNAILNNVPFVATGSPTIYYKQTASDGNHDFDGSVKSVVMTSQTQTVEVINTPPTLVTFNLKDANYTNLNIDSGTLTLS